MGASESPYSRSDWEAMDADELRQHVLDTWSNLKEKFDRTVDVPDEIRESITSFDTQIDVLLNDKLDAPTVKRLEQSVTR